MRHVLLFAAIMSLLTAHARCRGADLDPQILLELAKAKRLREAKQTPAVVKSTTCNCGITGRCQCWADECRCAACGLGGQPAGKALPGTRDTGARPADTSLLPGKELGLSVPNPAPSINTSARSAYQLGGTNCPNGQCASPATAQRRGLIFWR